MAPLVANYDRQAWGRAQDRPLRTCPQCEYRSRGLEHSTLGLICTLCWTPLKKRKKKTTAQEKLAAAEAKDFAAYKAELARAARIGAADPDEDFSTVVGQFLRSDAGYPLGPHYPQGSPTREDGQSHRAAWEAVVRRDPCSYCGKSPPAGTVDHIEPKSKRSRGIGGIAGKFTWLNFTAACGPCNNGKRAEPMLLWMLRRRR